MRSIETIPDLFHSFQTKNDEALVYHNGFRTFRYTYRELHERVLKCAALYAARGLSEGDKVVLWGVNSPEWVISFAALSHIGAIAVPLDFQTTPEAAEKIVRHAGATFVVKARSRSPFLTDYPTLFLDDLEEDLGPFAALPIKSSVTEDSVLEIVYTSGSTGDPKGVVLTHKNVLTNAKSVRSLLSLSQDDMALSVLPLSHMLEQTCGLIVPLLAGMRVYYAVALTPSSILRALCHEPITLMIVVPHVVHSLRDRIQSRIRAAHLAPFFDVLLRLVHHLPLSLRKKILFPVTNKFGSRFRYFVSGGAPLLPEDDQFWSALGFPILQGYGLTECAPVLSAEVSLSHRPQSVGHAVYGVELHVAPDGEILARGGNVFSGYYQNEEATHEVFREGWFCTGDLGEIDADGTLFIRGRKKEMIVTSAGKKVYPSDIEAVLNRSKGVRESCAVGIPEGGGERIVAAVIMEGVVDLRAVLKEANQHLDSSQHITDLIAWPESALPKTPTLKLKRSAVRQALMSRKNETEGTDSAPSRVIQLIAQVTGKEPTKIHSAQFLVRDCGLDSLARLELVALLEQELHCDISEDDITDDTKVKDLESHVETRARSRHLFEYPFWPHHARLRWVRTLCMESLYMLLPRLLVKRTIRGIENLETIKTPVLFAANHVSHLDQPTIYCSLPRAQRHTLSTIGWLDAYELQTGWRTILNPLKVALYCFAATTTGLVLLSPRASHKRSMEHVGRLIDQGESVLVFPEGDRTTSSELLPFKQGTALMAKSLAIPIVPIGTRGLERVFPRSRILPRPGRVYVSIGKPIHPGSKSLDEITEELKEAIENLKAE